MARRYGSSPSATVGWQARVQAAERGDDWELAERWRYWAYCLDEACAILAMRKEAAPPPADDTPAATGATLSKGVIKGRLPFRPDDCPAWIDALFPEGDNATLIAPSPLI